MINLLKKIFGTSQSRKLKKYFKIVRKINQIEIDLQKLSDEEVYQKTFEFKERLKKKESSVDELLPEAFAVVKNICRRLCGTNIDVSGYAQNWDMIPYDVQLVGAISLHYGSIAEMQTGEGKTLTASMPLYLNALTGKSTHLVTVNDYLARRDRDWMGILFSKLGISVGVLTNDTPIEKRKEIYQKDVVYGTASEFGFDYLRDNSMVSSKKLQCQRAPFYFAIVDEIDSILIDEARTPLIISGPSPVSRQMYDELKDNVTTIVRKQRDSCNDVASKARKTLNDLDLLQQKEEAKKLSKEDNLLFEESIKNLWLVSKGTPKNKILKKIKENTFLRDKIEQTETYYYSDQNKQEKAEYLSKLYILVEEKSNEFELTDMGINEWGVLTQQNDVNDFILIDIGYEYKKIDDDASLSDKEKIEKKLQLRETDSQRKERFHNLQQLFRAHLLMEKNIDYIVQENKIIIIDENTGRPQPGRRFSSGLHQAIEAKESVSIQRETQTYATVTLQNYFRMYEKLAGMTGTAITEASEFKSIYKLDVLVIPTYCACKRKDSDDEIYMTEREKYQAIIKEIKKINSQKRPILIGTESVEISEKLSRILRQNNLAHTILNAKNHEKEAEIISKAGEISSITISTNMAGRGTDIKLTKEVYDCGGLHVMGTTRHHSRRIDRQLRGRSGRLGDPGSSKFYISFEDSLLRLFTSPKISAILKRFRPPEGEPISAKILNKSLETAQKRVENRNFMQRKNTLEYDDVMNKQREEIYDFRNAILQSEALSDILKEIITNICQTKISEHFVEKEQNIVASVNGYSEWLMQSFPITFEKSLFNNKTDVAEIERVTIEKISTSLDKKIEYQKDLIKEYVDKEKAESESLNKFFNELIRSIIIRRIDKLWQEHLLSIDHLRNDIYLRTIGQKDPVLEFKEQAFSLFDKFSYRLQLEISKNVFNFDIQPPKEERRQVTTHVEKSFTTNKETTEERPKTIVRIDKKHKRNELCTCGSGKKYKKCCAVN